MPTTQTFTGLSIQKTISSNMISISLSTGVIKQRQIDEYKVIIRLSSSRRITVGRPAPSNTILVKFQSCSNLQVSN